MKYSLVLCFLLAPALSRAGLINPDGFLWLPNLQLIGGFGDVHNVQDVSFDYGGVPHRELDSQGQNGAGGLEVYLPTSRYMTLHGGFSFAKSQSTVSAWAASPVTGRNPDYTSANSDGSTDFYFGLKFFPFEIKPQGPAIWGINANPSGRYWRPILRLNWDTSTSTADETLTDRYSNTLGTASFSSGLSSYALALSMPFYQYLLEAYYLKNYQRSWNISGSLVGAGSNGLDDGDTETYKITLKTYLYDPSKLANDLPDWNPDGVLDVFSFSLWTAWTQHAGQWGGNSLGFNVNFPISSYVTPWCSYSFSTFGQPYKVHSGETNFTTTSTNASSQVVSLGVNLYWPDHDPIEEENPAYVAK